jgi:hypothetical protein
MNTLRFTITAGLSCAAALAMALGQPASADTTVPIDGGGASGITLGGSPAAGSPRARADVAAEARAAYRQLNSRSGEQTDAEDMLHMQVTSTRSREEVRNEGIAFARQAHDVFEGGQSGALAQARRPAREPVTHMASTSD